MPSELMPHKTLSRTAHMKRRVGITVLIGLSQKELFYKTKP